MKDDLVSIVIPTFNAEKYLSQCMDSVLKQTYENIEVVLVDDGSSDHTSRICEEYIDKDSRVKFIQGGHAGASYARNTGINHCTGRYITFVDSDDIVEPNLIEQYMKTSDYFEYANKMISFIMVGMFFDDYCDKKIYSEKKLLDYKERVFSLTQDKISLLIWLRLFNFCTNKMYDLKAIMDNNIRFKNEIRIAEDLQFNLDYLEHKKGDFGIINEALYHYVKRSEQSLSLSYYEHAVAHTKLVYQKLISYAKETIHMDTDGLLVLESIYINDWTSRLTALYSDKEHQIAKKVRFERVQREICSPEFQELLDRVFAAGKISGIRYYALKMKNYRWFYFLRRIYRYIN